MKTAIRLMVIAAATVVVILVIGWHSRASSQAWSKQVGTDKYDYASCLVRDGGGNLYLVGGTGGSLVGANSGGDDLFVIKYDSSGSQLWSVQFGSDKTDAPAGAAVDSSNNLYVVGSTSGNLFGDNIREDDAFIVKLSAASGSVLWSKHLGTTDYDSAEAVAIDAQNNAYVIGSTDGSLFGADNGADDIFIVKYDQSGSQIWAKQMGTSDVDHPRDVAVDNAGGLYVVGATYDLFPPALGEEADAFLAKLSASDGSVVWGKQFGTDEADNAAAVRTGPGGEVYAAGTMNIHDTLGPEAAFLARYNSSGEQVWLRQLNTAGWEGASATAVDGQGNVFITGLTRGSLFGANAGWTDVFLAEYDPAGNVITSYQFGTSAEDTPCAIALGSTDEVYVAGTTKGNLYGTNAGGEDAFLVKFETTAKPIFSPDGGTYSTDQSVTMTSTTGATIRYTTDGSDPTTSSTQYQQGTPVAVDHSLTLKAKAWKADYIPSLIKTATYTMKVATPTFNPDGGEYEGPQNVMISCSTTGATIRYTTDGSEPTSNSTQYSSPVFVGTSLMLKAKAFKPGWSDSDTKSAQYVIIIPP